MKELALALVEIGAIYNRDDCARAFKCIDDPYLLYYYPDLSHDKAVLAYDNDAGHILIEHRSCSSLSVIRAMDSFMRKYSLEYFDILGVYPMTGVIRCSLGGDSSKFSYLISSICRRNVEIIVQRGDSMVVDLRIPLDLKVGGIFGFAREYRRVCIDGLRDFFKSYARTSVPITPVNLRIKTNVDSMIEASFKILRREEDKGILVVKTTSSKLIFSMLKSMHQVRVGQPKVTSDSRSMGRLLEYEFRFSYV